jgi:molybdopterin converting factor subunit 1
LTVTVLLFARPREMVGAGHLELEVGEAATPASVFEQLAVTTPRLRDMRRLLRCAIDQEYADWDAPLRAGAEIAFIPPTAGG